MTTADDLRLLITGYTEMVANLDIMITNIDAELTSLDAEITTIEDGVMDVAQASLDSRLEAKRVANGWQSVLTNYTSSSISSWDIWGYDGSPISAGLTRLDDNNFKFSGMSLPTFTTGTKVKCQAGDVERTILSQVIIAPEPGPDPPAAPGSVTVSLEAGPALPDPLNNVERCEIVYTYLGTGWDSDAGIIQDQDAFALAYDEINAAIDLNGTYGLSARISNITVGRDVQVLNRTKYQEFVTLYEPYAAP